MHKTRNRFVWGIQLMKSIATTVSRKLNFILCRILICCSFILEGTLVNIVNVCKRRAVLYSPHFE